MEDPNKVKDWIDQSELNEEQLQRLVQELGVAKTPYELCVIAHNGECGVCNSNGSFTPCG